MSRRPASASEPRRKAREFAAKRRIRAGRIHFARACQIQRGPRGACPVGKGGKNVLMLDNALAMVDNVVAMKLGL